MIRVRDTWSSWAAFGLAIAAVPASVSFAGDLAPPAGLIQATDRIPINHQAITYPFNIGKPGSYVLTSRLSGVNGQNGIVIQGSHVTIDLNGFAIQGSAGSFNGIIVVGAQTDIVIRNGFINGWSSSGISAAGATNCVLENVHVRDCGNTGILLGPGARVEGCVSNANLVDGLVVGEGSVLITCAASGNVGLGISGGLRSRIESCIAVSNGAIGIVASNGSSAIGCIARDNGATGIALGELATAENCTASLSVGQGITLSFNAVARGCTSEQNTTHGFGLSTGAIVLNCTARGNDGRGISAGAATLIQGCSSFMNADHGILVGAGALVTGNTCVNNGTPGMGGAGIHTNFSNVRIDGNSVIGNQAGIDVLQSGCLITRNSASDNILDFNINGGSAFGPIIDVSAGGDISGIAGAIHPWANFEY